MFSALIPGVSHTFSVLREHGVKGKGQQSHLEQGGKSSVILKALIYCHIQKSIIAYGPWNEGGGGRNNMTIPHLVEGTAVSA